MAHDGGHLLEEDSILPFDLYEAVLLLCLSVGFASLSQLLGLRHALRYTGLDGGQSLVVPCYVVLFPTAI